MKLTRICNTLAIEFFSADLSTGLELPLASSFISAGFPSPADDYLELKLDLNRALVRHPNATFYGRVKGSSMIDAGIGEGDILVIDKSLDPKDGDIAVCFIDGEFTVKRISNREEGLCLMPANEEFRPIRVSGESDFQVWGIVTYVIHKCRGGGK
ncbi:MAG: translesion error-prone DNA polymerase V autoproteolytic subunit [Chlorobiaceae bacterium]|nr:translesion error-prone DNA polymerase V autoproteolytic subunit [Chlorobiaceae bacterium]